VQVLSAAKSLSDESNRLKLQVSKFQHSVRADRADGRHDGKVMQK
jgi:hypothetical protein